MDLYLPTIGLERYQSASQRARVGTESWGAENFFCPACESPRLKPSPQGTAAVDYVCPSCDSPFQLKSQSKPLGSRIVDAAFSEMKRAILEDRTPNLYVLHYDLTRWAVQTVILIPHFAFALSAVERRKPLAATARRAGWVGCNIVLDKIPVHARIPVIEEGNIRAKQAVCEDYERLRPLERLHVQKRGWTLDVLQVVQSLTKPKFENGKSKFEKVLKNTEFTLADVYAQAGSLGRLHPGNRHIQAKIRQQLQVLRDLGLITFLGGGCYRMP